MDNGVPKSSKQILCAKPLPSKSASEVAYQLVDNFLLLAALHILQSDNGADFTAAIINELKDLWKDLVIVHGKPWHHHSQGSVECANGDIKDMLVAWMGENETINWTTCIKFVQFSKTLVTTDPTVLFLFYFFFFFFWYGGTDWTCFIKSLQ